MYSIILGSSSKYRRELLESLQLPFTQASPDIDETAKPNESSRALSERLAIEKAEAIAKANPDALVIGSDQVAEIDGIPNGKSGDFATAFAQLRRASGKTCHFYTTVAVAKEGEPTRHVIDVVEVVFRDLSDDEITRYLEAEEPYDCAGSFKSEGLGVSLFSAIRSEQPGSLIGLPMISTCQLLREFGVPLP